MPLPPKMTMKRAALAAAAVLVGGLASCGKSDSESQPRATGESDAALLPSATNGADFLGSEEVTRAAATRPPDRTQSEALRTGRGDGFLPQRPEFEAIAERLYGGENTYLGHGQIERFRRILENPALTVPQRIEATARLALQHLKVGHVDEAVSQLDNAVALAETADVDVASRAMLIRMRALSHLRQAEVQNCIIRHNRECCIFPLAGGGVHAVRQPALDARRDYEAYLQLQPGDPIVGWLLNVIAMALGDYPRAVPLAYRIPPEVFDSEYDIGRFEDIAPTLGVDTFNLCGGVIAQDFDGDGLIDIVTSTYDPKGPLTYYRNLGNGRFEDLSSASRLDDQLGGLNCIGADYDNDGDVDILVLRGAWLFDNGQIRNSLLRNNGDGTFTDVTRRAGLALPACPTQAAAFGDFDNDGDLDLYITNESREQWGQTSYPSQLFRNNGDGTFTDVATSAGVTNDRYGKGVTTGDYDNDGDLDIYVSNIFPNRLYRNNGDMTFTDVAPELGLTQPKGRSFATWFFDYDNDGWLDLFVAAYDASVADVAADAVGAPHRALLPCLYHNNGDGTFTNVAEEAGIAHPYLPMGANFGDADNDGWLDMYLTTGNPNYETLMPNVMLRNDGGKRFQDVSRSAGVGHLQKGHGVAFADLDNDGDQDIYHQLGGFYPGDRFANALFLNHGHGNHHLTVRLVGKKSNTHGFGARIKVVVRTPQGRREIHRAVGSVSSFGGSPFRQEIGLGDATAIERLEVFWPASGIRQTLVDVPLDSMIRVTEGEDGYEALNAPTFDFPTD